MQTQTKKIETKEQIKKDIYNDCIISFKTSFKKDEDDFINLQVTINGELKKILSKLIVNGDAVNFNYCDIEYKRHKVKSFVYTDLSSYSSSRDFLFCVDLLKYKKIEIRVVNSSSLYDLTHNLKSNAKKVIETFYNLKKSSETYRIKIEKYDNEND